MGILKINEIELSPFIQIITEKCGIFFDEVREVRLLKGLQERMCAKELDPKKYLNALKKNEEEFFELVNLVTINETYFFREPAYINLLIDKLIPEILERKKPGEKVKIFCAGSSTGEEPYTLAMAVMEKYGVETDVIFPVTAVDIDLNVVRTARKGVFRKLSFRDFDDALLKKYFNDTQKNRFELRDFVKKRVQFHVLNLLEPVYPSDFFGVDVVFYRNVSIYFKHEVQKTILQKLSDLLNIDGYLLLSSSESFVHNVGILKLVEKEGLFLYQKSEKIEVGERRVNPFLTKKSVFVKKKPATGSSGTGAARQYPAMDKRIGYRKVFDEALALTIEKKHEAAMQKIDSLLSEYTPFAKAYTLKASIYVNLKVFDKAVESCLEAIKLDKVCIEAYALLGLIAEMMHESGEAVKHFKEALFLNPSSWLLHYFLGENFQISGENAQAIKEYKITLKLHEKGRSIGYDLSLFPLAFPAEQYIKVCKQNLNKLEQV